MKANNQGYSRAFWAAVLITLVLWVVPFGALIIYPFSLLATWAHEMGHGLAALAVGGEFHKLELFGDLSGVAMTSSRGTLSQALVSAGGLVGAPILGAVIIALGPRTRLSRVILIGLALTLLLSVVLWVRNIYGAVACLTLGGAIFLMGWRLNQDHRFLAVQLLGIQLTLSALRGWRYFFMDSADVGGRVLPSDVASIANALGGPPQLWGALLIIFNLALLFTAFRLASRRLISQ